MTLPSPATVAAGTDAAPLVTLGLRSGETEIGRLRDFSPEKPDFHLAGDGSAPRTFRARHVAYIAFHSEPLEGIDPVPQGAEAYKVHVAGSTVFEVWLVPGSWKNSVGFYATPRKESPFRDLFFYNHGVRARERDEPIGTMLLKQGALHPDALDHAVSAQQNERATPIGQILVESLKVTERDVERAVALQKSRKQRIGEVLQAEGLATKADIEAALAEQQRRKGKRLGQVLVDMNIVTEQTLVKTLAKKFDLPFVDLSDYEPDRALMDELPPAIAEKYGVLPLSLHGDALVVATSDPLALDAVELADLRPNRQIELVITTPSALQRGLNSWLGHDVPSPASIDGSELELLLKRLADEHRELGRLSEAPSDPPAHEATLPEHFNALVQEASKRSATHIHLESDGNGSGVLRLRTKDGCRALDLVPPALVPALLDHIVKESHLNPNQRDVPQQGSCVLETAQARYELGVSLTPVTPDGSDLVLAFATASRPRLELSQLGFSPGTLRAFQRVIEQPSGLILFAGPLGSGRTTAMHAALGAIDGSRFKVWAAEDELAFGRDALGGAETHVRHLQVKPHLGFGFASALRCLMRADADVILVAEIDDPETARIALDCVHARRRVFSALNARSVVQAVSRLLDMPIDALAIASSLRGVLGQRLVRRLCTECRQSAPATLSERDALARACREMQLESLSNWIFEPDLVFWHNRGCPACQGSGYSGTMALHEFLVINGELSRAIADRAAPAELRAVASKAGMTTLLQDGIAKALAGLTDLNQVLGAVQS